MHGDARLSNVCRTPDGRTLYLDSGFLAHRPRVHDLAYTMAFQVLRDRDPSDHRWDTLPALLRAYEAGAGTRLQGVERRALVPYTAAVCLCHAALAGFMDDPAGQLRSRQPMLRLADGLLAHGADVPAGM